MQNNSVMTGNSPTDVVIGHIKELMQSGVLEAGSRLPSERKLAEVLGVGRTHVRTALQKLEFYGIIHTLPQSGSVVAEMRMQALDSLISEVMSINEYDFFSLVETRIVLETEGISLASQRADAADMDRIWRAHYDYIEHFEDDMRVDKDLYFHRVIAQASHNEVLKSMLLIITPDIMHHYQAQNFCATPQATVIDEHRRMIEAIESHDAAKAGAVMRIHLDDLYTFAKGGLKV